jgi:hypothetical protein
VSLVASGGHGPTPTVAEARGLAPERVGERVAVVDAADRSGTAPELVGSKRAAPEQGFGPLGEETLGALQDVSS